MNALLDNSFVQRLSVEFVGKILDMSGAMFDEYDFAMFLADYIDGARIYWTKDGIGVVCNKLLIKPIVQEIKCPNEVKHVQWTCSLNDALISDAKGFDENDFGEMILDVWNARFEKELEAFSDLRTIVLIRDKALSNFSVLEFETHPFDPNTYTWEWNQNGNLEGYEKDTDVHRFTWQPHGSQFTHIPPIPAKRLKIHLKRPPCVNHDVVLNEIKFDPSWIEIVE